MRGSATNPFKAALGEGRQQLGLWCVLASAFVAEALAGSGYDWLLLDMEHSPAEPLTILAMLQAVAPYEVSPVVRPPSNDPVVIKRLLDFGAQTLLIPYVQSAEEAQRAVAAVRYPPDGVRGVSSLTRATGFGRNSRYGREAADQICLLVQVETAAALEQLEAIAAVPGIDGIFIGPGDLAASLGRIGEPGHPVVVAAIEDALRRLAALGKPSGILTADPVFARRCIELGCGFTALGVDLAMLARGADALVRDFRTSSLCLSVGARSGATAGGERHGE
jgi:4-hydroxy-2-oxoheptanedioate aldolase